MKFPQINALWPVKEMIEPDYADKLSNVEIFELDNGIRVVAAHGESDRSSYFKVLLNAGALHQKKRGLPHFVEHLVHQGTEEFPDWKALTEHAEDFNLSNNGWTGMEAMGFYVEADNDDESIHAALKHLSQVVLHPLLPESKLAKEREVVLGERQAAMSNPHDFAFEVFNNHFFEESHPYAGGGVIGSEEDILSFDLEEARQFYADYFIPENMVLVVAGGKTIAEYKQLVQDYFGGAERGKGWTPNPIAKLKRVHDHRLTEVEKDFNHVDLSLGIYLDKDRVRFPSPEYYALRVGTFALSTRVFMDVRDKQGLAYSTGASLLNLKHGYLYHLYGEFPKSKYQQGRTELERYVKDVLINPITEAEFQRAMRYLISTRWARGAREIANDVADSLYFYGQPLSPEGLRQIITSLTVERVNEVHQQLLADLPIDVVAVGPLEMSKQSGKPKKIRKI